MTAAANNSRDGVEPIDAPLPLGYWTQPAGWLRGGFRFLTVVSTTDEPVTLSNVSCHLTFMPHFDDLRDYAGYFYAKDPLFDDEDFLTKLWYAGAYTVQMNSIPVDQGRVQPSPPTGVFFRHPVDRLLTKLL